MNIENDPPMTSSTPTSGADDDWDNVVFDDTQAPGTPASGGAFKKRGPSKTVKYGGGLLALLLIGGGVLVWLGMEETPAPPTPATMVVDQHIALSDPAMDPMVDPMAAPMTDENMFPPQPDMMNGDVITSDTGQMEQIEMDELAAAYEVDDMGMSDDQIQPAGPEVVTFEADAEVPPEMMPDDQTDVVVEEKLSTDVSVVQTEPAADVVGDFADLNAGDTIPAGLTQEEIDAQLEKQLIDSLMDSTAPATAESVATDSVDGDNNAGAPVSGQTAITPGDINRAENMARIEANALVAPQPENFYIVRSETAPVEQNRILMNAKRAVREGRYVKALNMFDQLYEINPNDPAVILGRGVALQHLGRYNEALNVYEQVLRENPDNLEALTNMLGILSVQNPAYSVDKLERLQARYPQNAGIKVQLALAYGDMNRVQDAGGLLMAASNLDPRNPTIAYNLAVMYDRMGDAVNAAMWYRRALMLEDQSGMRGTIPVDAIQNRLSSLR